MFFSTGLTGLISKTLMAVSAFTVILSCGSPDTPEPKNEPLSLPPTLSENSETSAAILVKLDERQIEELRIETQEIVERIARYPIVAPGTVFPAPDNISIASAPVNGRVVEIYAHEGETVSKGEVLLEIESLEFATLVAEYLRTAAEAEYEENNYKRLQLLVEKKISPQRALDKAESDLEMAQASEQAAKARLQSIGFTNVEDLISGTHQGSQTRLKIYAAIDGIINEHLIDLGQPVTAYDKLLTILNMDQVMVRAYVAPEDGVLIKPGDPVTISLKDYAQLMQEASITTINPALDQINKAINVNIIFTPKGQWPKPGQNVRVEIIVTTHEPVLSIPTAAVQYEGQNATVFVKRDRNTFEKRVISLSKFTGNQAIVESGLQSGEEVAVTQVFSLKALSKYDEFAE
jgi:cobalt-zinc-cadmium efflux system membrane fusion protein